MYLDEKKKERKIIISFSRTSKKVRKIAKLKKRKKTSVLKA